MDRHQVIALGRGSAARFRRWLALAVLATAGAVLGAGPLHAQDEAAAPRIRSAAELEQLVGPIALYADDLVGIVLPASTYPLQVVQAARFLDARAKDSTLQPNDTWDDSIVALLNYPEVVKKMNDDLDWTYDLGEAVLNQRADVLDAVQKFRGRAYTSGNLRSDDKQVVANTNNEITIAPANPQVVYVPYYEPERVVVYQSAPVFYYYPYAYPLYYYPYPVGYAFHTGYFWGVTTAFVIGWHSHYVNVYHYGYYGHPYYGHAYHDSFYVRNDIHGNTAVSRSGYAWNPGPRHDGRPFVRSDDHYVRTPGSVRTPGAVHTPGNGTALHQEGRASGGTLTAPSAQAAERSSTAPSRSGSYRNPGQTNGQTSFAAPPATRERPTTRPADNANGAARGQTTTTPTAPRDDAANRGGGSSHPNPNNHAADSGADPRRGIPERSMSLNGPSAQRYTPPAAQYSVPSGTSQRALPTAPGSRSGGVYRSGGSTQPSSGTWSAPSVPSGGGAAIARPPPQAARPAQSGGAGAPRPTFGGASQGGGRAESHSSYAAPPRDSGGGDRSSNDGGQGGGSYRGNGGGGGGGGSHGGGRDASQRGSR